MLCYADVLGVAEQCLHRGTDFSASHVDLPTEAGSAQESGRRHSKDSWPKPGKGVFHTIWHHAEYIKWGEAARGCCIAGIGWAMMSSCTVPHLVCILYHYYYYFSVLLNYLYLKPEVLLFFFFPFFSSPSPIPLLRGGSEQAAAWCLTVIWG